LGDGGDDGDVAMQLVQRECGYTPAFFQIFLMAKARGFLSSGFLQFQEI
jgi:hypothetical protein